MLSDVNKLERSVGGARASGSAPNPQPAAYVSPRLTQLRSLYSAEQNSRVTATLEKAFLASHNGSPGKIARDFEQLFLRAQLVSHDSSLNRTQQRQKLDTMFQDFSTEHYRDPLLTRCRDFVSNNKIVTLAALLCVAAGSFEIVRRINLPEANIPAEKSNRELYIDYQKSVQDRAPSRLNRASRPDSPPLNIELNDYGLGKSTLAKKIWLGDLYSPFGPVQVRYQGAAKVIGAAERFDQQDVQGAPVGSQLNFTDPKAMRSASMQREIKSVVIPPAGHLDLELSTYHDEEAQRFAKYWDKYTLAPEMLTMKLDQFVVFLNRITGEDIELLEEILVTEAKLDPRTISSFLGVVNADNSNELVASILHKAGYSAAINYGYQLERIGLNKFENKWAASEILVETQTGFLRYDANRRVGQVYKDLVFSDEDFQLLLNLAFEVTQTNILPQRRQKLEQLGTLLTELLESDKYKQFRAPMVPDWSEEESTQLREDCANDVNKKFTRSLFGSDQIAWRRNFNEPSAGLFNLQSWLVSAGLIALLITLNRANRRRITEKTMQLYQTSKQKRDAELGSAGGTDSSSLYDEPVELLSKPVQVKISRLFYNSVNPISETTTSRADHILFYKCLAAVWLTRRRTILPTWPKDALDSGEQFQIVKARELRSAKIWSRFLKEDRADRIELLQEIAGNNLGDIYAKLKFNSGKVLVTALKKCLGITSGQTPTSARSSFKRRSVGELSHTKSAAVKSINWRRTAGLDSGFYVNSAPESDRSESIKLNAYVNIDDADALTALVGTLLSASYSGAKLNGRVRFCTYGEKLPQEFDLGALQTRAGRTLASAKSLLGHLVNIFADQTCWYVTSNQLNQIPPECILIDRGPKLLYGLTLVEVPNSVGIALGYLEDSDAVSLGIVNGASQLEKLKGKL